jgi:hypothetical protein
LIGTYSKELIIHITTNLSKDNVITYCHFPLQNENIMHNLKEEIKEKILEREKVVEDYGLTLEFLEEYDANRPLFEGDKDQRDSCVRQIMSERVDKVLMTLSLSPIIK